MAAAKARGMTPLETMIDRPERTPGQAPVADSMQETAFGLSANGVSQPIKTPTGWVVMKNVETRPPTVPPWPTFATTCWRRCVARRQRRWPWSELSSS